MSQHVEVKTTDLDASTPLEVAWSHAPKNHAILPVRNYFYDPSSVMYYWPQEFEGVQLGDWDSKKPDRNWIIENVSSMVLGSIDATMPSVDYTNILQPSRIQYTSDFLLHQLLEYFDANIVYGSLLSPIIFDENKSAWEKIHLLLSHPVIGNPIASRHMPIEVLKSRFEHIAEKKLPIQIILPAFPFKDQNPFRTNVSANHVDLGEILTLILMHSLALALFQVYPFGVEWIIISDGIAYSDIFGIPKNQAAEYQSHLKMFRNHLNIQKTVHIIDLMQLVQKADGFDELFSYLKIQLRTIDNEGVLKEKIAILARGMRWNLNTKEYLEKISREELWNAIHQTDNKEKRRSSHLTKIYEVIGETAKKAAVDYLAFNLSMKYLDLLAKFFPHSLRATVHPKYGQIPLPRIGEVYPWNGVPLVIGDEQNIREIKVLELYKINTKEFAETRLLGSTEAFYYTV